MRRSLFVSILHDIQQVNEYFIQTRDATGAPGLSGIQKMTVALRILQYGMPADAVEKYIRIDESTAIAALNFFTRSIVATYESVYLRSPNEADVTRLLQEGEQRGFLGMSPLFAELTRGRAPTANYTINNHAYTMGYYLANGIYPRWATIVKKISQPQAAKIQLFARIQEACRKDVERAFGMLQARFNIVRVLARGWSDEDLYYIMKTCIILHNMIIEDKRDIAENERSAAQLQTETSNTRCQVSRDLNEEYAQFMLNRQRIGSIEGHHQDFLPIGLLPLAETLPSPIVGLLLTLGLVSSSREMQLSIGELGAESGKNSVKCYYVLPLEHQNSTQLLYYSNSSSNGKPLEMLLAGSRGVGAVVVFFL
ncbi:uncharacterized protein LOC114311375 [Camellia sinensis]|uniref:uncharacterized protein LOC114311375 n=1 Tax=Camellia sinensis TaxID=4442 RepID=UPI001035AF60|nr:uncharacterized protein LOC114311375 [Camellia sinensis]